jgi:selenide,water dikinase
MTAPLPTPAMPPATRLTYGAEVSLPEGFAVEDRALLGDPQTRGGWLVSCDASVVAEVLAIFMRHGFDAALEIGQVLPADAGARLVVR